MQLFNFLWTTLTFTAHNAAIGLVGWTAVTLFILAQASYIAVILSKIVLIEQPEWPEGDVQYETSLITSALK